MPIIDLKEIEEAVVKGISTTENSVLIPMLYCRAYSKEGERIIYTETPKAKRFTKLADLKKALGSKVVKVTESTDENAETDKSYIMACELLSAGLTVIVKPILFDNASFEKSSGTIVQWNKVIEILSSAFGGNDEHPNGALDEFTNKNMWNVKFITAGAYPTIGKATKDATGSLSLHAAMKNVAYARKDAVALLDLRDGFTDENELLSEVKVISPGSEYTSTATWFPWCRMSVVDNNIEKVATMPGSFGYLKAFANSIKNNASWFAASGVTRGYIPGLVAPTFEVSEALMHILQGDEGYTTLANKYTSFKRNEEGLQMRINTIMNTGSSRYRIWGNMTTAILSTTGTQRYYKEFLNVRLMMSELFKVLYDAAMITMFEPDDDITWISFKSRVNSGYLEKAKSGRGVEWYKWTKEQPEDKAELVVTLELKPIEAIDTIRISTILTEDSTSVEEQ